MIRVRTGSRLHFGLFSLPSEQSKPWVNQEGEATLPWRDFGGAGLMIDKPGIDLTVEKAERQSAEGPLAERALRYSQDYRDILGIASAFQIRVHSTAPEHSGLGTGTQLGLAVARGMAELTDQDRNPAVLAARIGRGARSAIGVHGFERGGFLVEGGKTSESSISPLVASHAFPEDWRILLVFPRDLQGVHGARERDAFASLGRQHFDERNTETMCRIVMLGLIPALLERDHQTFSEAVYDYNRRAGEMFQLVQGGVYSHPWTEKAIKIIRDVKVKGVGQSSWGPVVFAMVTGGQAMGLCDWLIKKKGYHSEQLLLTSARNQGAELSTEY